jgi:ketosteroid isomerase-like protein
MTAAEQKERALKFIAGLDKGDPGSFEGLLTDDFEFEIMGKLPGFKPIHGKDNFINGMLPGLKQLFPTGLNFTIGTVISEGPHVAIQASSKTLASNGRPYANRYHWYIHFNGDKISQFREYADTNHIKETVS